MKKIFAACLISTLLFSSCENSEPKHETSAEEIAASTPNSKILKVDKVTFSVPSPIQVSFLVKKSGAPYKKEMMNNSSHASSYNNNFKRAINLGIYGADLGFCTMYEQTQDALGLMNAVRQLADALGVAPAFNDAMMKRFSTNLGKKDSIFAIVADAYRNSDGFFKSNERNDINALVLTGGWIEAMHFMTTIAKTNSNQELLDRIGEQKIALSNLIKLLIPFQEQKEISNLIDRLVKLQHTYDEIKMEYSFQESAHDESKKFTVINSESKIVWNNTQLEKIASLVSALRAEMIK